MIGIRDATIVRSCSGHPEISQQILVIERIIKPEIRGETRRMPDREYLIKFKIQSGVHGKAQCV